MTRDNPEQASDRTELTQDAITEELADVSTGDKLVFNNREGPYEIVETDRYSVTVVDPEGNRIRVSQNLQTGGWIAHEDIWWVDMIDESNE